MQTNLIKNFDIAPSYHPVLKDKDEVTVHDLFNAVRFGIKSQVARILTQSKELVNAYDDSGYTCAHWAAKKGDTDMLELLHSFGGALNQQTDAESRMLPIHWAASEGKIASIRYLLEKRVDINAQDANGCTPLIIAAQHDVPNCMVYLIKNGADVSLVDKSGDTALHWAAYKGFVSPLAVMAYFTPSHVNQPDHFGQTPAHLSSLRGEITTLSHLIYDSHADLSIKDRNGLTPLDIAVKKGRLESEWTIRRALYKHTVSIIISMGLGRALNARVLKLSCFGANDAEAGQWAWRIVFLSNLIGSLISLSLLTNPLMSDLYLIHLTNTILQTCFWICFFCCLVKSPSLVPQETNHIAEYEHILSLIGSNEEMSKLPGVCHTCRVVKPLRSKHCKVKNVCINKFDHYCPFVGNSIGRDNYKYFIGCLFFYFIGGITWEFSVMIYAHRVTISWYMASFMVYCGFWIMMVGSLLSFHFQLLATNYTTNERIGLGKYNYLKNAHGMIHNPFSKHSVMDNIYDGLFPSKKLYYTRVEVTGELMTSL